MTTKYEVIDIEELFKEFDVEKHTKEKTLVQDDEYIDWLTNYVKAEGSITGNKHIVSAPDETTKEKLLNLSYLYNAIDKYGITIKAAKANAINQEYYTVEYNNEKYNIGYYVFEGVWYYCKPAEFETTGIVKFEDMKNYYKNNKDKKEKVKTIGTLI